MEHLPEGARQVSVPMKPTDPATGELLTAGDFEDTAELPVLDVEAYEASLEEDQDSHTDTWVAPQAAFQQGVTADTEATAQHVVLSPGLTAAGGVDLGGLTATLHAVEDRLRQKGERLVALERELSAARADHASATAKSAESTRILTNLQESLDAAEAARAQAEAQLAQRDETIIALEARLAEAAAEHEVALIRVNTDVVLQREQSDATLAALQEQADARLVALRDRTAVLERELEQMTSDHDAAACRIRELEADMSSRYSDLELQATARENEYNARLAERDHDLSAAEEALQRLENELKSKNAKLGELASASDDWRSTIVESQQALAERDQRIRQLETEIASTATAFGKIQQSIERLDPMAKDDDVPVDGPQRLLIRSDGNTEFVHQLSRRTRIGRGPDNDLQINAQFISRHHAVIMAGPVHTILEDLNSTNGVFVNGKRVSRQTLKDGDRVTVGRMQFRYSVRTSVTR